MYNFQTIRDELSLLKNPTNDNEALEYNNKAQIKVRKANEKF